MYKFPLKYAQNDGLKCLNVLVLDLSLRLSVYTGLQRMYFFISIITLCYILLKWTIICGKNKFCFEILLIFVLRRIFFQVTIYARGFFLGGIFSAHLYVYIYLRSS